MFIVFQPESFQAFCFSAACIVFFNFIGFCFSGKLRGVQGVHQARRAANLVFFSACIAFFICFLFFVFQATPEEYKQFTRLDEQLTANEIVAFRLKAIAELEEEQQEEEEGQGQGQGQALPSSRSPSSNLTVSAGEQDPPRQTWGQWLLRRDPVPITAVGGGGDDDASSSGGNRSPAGAGAGAGPGGGAGAVAGAASQREDAAAQAEFLRAFSSPGDDDDGDEDAAEEHKHRCVCVGVWVGVFGCACGCVCGCWLCCCYW